jgi:heterodisulfide reductase subunit A
VGSLDGRQREYCSGICCQYAFKFSHLIGKKLPGTKRHHYVKEIVAPGKEGFALFAQAREDRDTAFTRYRDGGDLALRAAGGKIAIRCRTDAGGETETVVDMAILCPAAVPGVDAGALGAILDVGRDRFGFFEERQSRTDAVQSTVKGVFVAGACLAPTDVRGAMDQGLAAAGQALAWLVPGRKLEVSPVTATVEPARCSGCRVCLGLCPYGALAFDPESQTARVNDVLCAGCGTCVAACPTGAIRARHFTSGQILAEIGGLLP